MKNSFVKAAEPHVGSYSQCVAQCATFTMYADEEFATLFDMASFSGTICEELNLQTNYVRRFMNSTCTSRTDTQWCLIDDSVHKLWYDTDTVNHVTSNRPASVKKIFAVEPAHSLYDPDVWSYFERTNPATGANEREFIEPLVSSLRHPLARCVQEHGDEFLGDRSYVLPPAKSAQGRTALYFDAGASQWSKGLGGPSLSYFADVWARNGIVWEHIEAWDCKGPEDTFYASVPPEWKEKVSYHQKCISTDPSIEPFVPSVIRNTRKPNDYVLFKLDIDSKEVETAIVDYLLSSDNNDLDYIDEFLWEQHVDSYILAPNWAWTMDMSKTLADSYDYFLRLRNRGVRAHSWV